jgi:hypothetical protein
MNRSQLKTVFLVSLMTLTAFISLTAASTNVRAQFREKTMPGVNVLIFANTSTSALTVSLGLDPTVKVEVFNGDINDSTDLHNLNFTKIEVIIFDSYLPTDIADLHYLIGNINGSFGAENMTGVLFFGGNYSTASITEFSRHVLPIEFVIYKDALNNTISDYFYEQTGMPNPLAKYYEGIYNNTQAYEIRTSELGIDVSDEQNAAPVKSMYVTRLAWQSCPLLYDRILTYSKRVGAQTLVEVPSTKEPLLVTWNKAFTNGTIQVIYLSPGTAWVNGKEWNKPFHLWPYFNYMMYMMVYDLKGKGVALTEDEIESYAQWPWSPIPHQLEATLWMIFVASLWVFNFVLFFKLGRKKDKRNVKVDVAAAPSSALSSDAAKPEEAKQPESKDGNPSNP